MLLSSLTSGIDMLLDLSDLLQVIVSAFSIKTLTHAKNLKQRYYNTSFTQATFVTFSSHLAVLVHLVQ